MDSTPSAHLLKSFFAGAVLVGLLVTSGLLAFDSSGIKSVKNSLNETTNGMQAVANGLSNKVDAVCAYAASRNSICDADALQNFKTKLEHVSSSNVGNEHKTVADAWGLYNKIGLNSTLDSNEAVVQALQTAWKDFTKIAGDYERIDRVEYVCFWIFLSSLVYFVVVIIFENLLRYYNVKMQNKSIRSSLLYWLTHLHVFFLLAGGIFVYTTFVSRNYFVDDIEEFCLFAGDATDHWPYSDKSHCMGAVDDVYNSMWYYVNILFFLILAIVSSHFDIRHGPIDKGTSRILQGAGEYAMETIERGAKVPSAKRVVKYAALTSVHNRK
jgi:hypothetical protein